MKHLKRIKSFFLLVAIFILVALVAGCSISNTGAFIGSPLQNSSSDQETNSLFRKAFHDTIYDTVQWHNRDLDESFSMLEATLVTMQGYSIVAEGEGVAVDGSKLVITAAGTYIIAGELKNAQIMINTPGDESVRIILNGVDLTNNNGAPFFVQNAGAVVVTLAEGTVNTFTDGEEYFLTDKDAEPDAAFFSCSDLTINGSGSLIVFGKYRNGLVSKKDLKIINSNVKVNATEIGIRGSELIAIRDATVAVKAGSDGIQAVSEQDPARGLVIIKGGSLEIYAQFKGIQAAANLVVVDGEIVIESGYGLKLNNGNDL